jgi:hypothetical protein
VRELEVHSERDEVLLHALVQVTFDEAAVSVGVEDEPLTRRLQLHDLEAEPVERFPQRLNVRSFQRDLPPARRLPKLSVIAGASSSGPASRTTGWQPPDGFASRHRSRSGRDLLASTDPIRRVDMYAKAIAAVALALGLVLASPAVARADAVTDWNGYATTVIVTNERQLPQVSPLRYAMVQGAVYDAVNGIDRRYRPYLVLPAANPWDSQDAAAATAAFRVLVALFPNQLPTLQPLYDSSLAAIPDGPAKAGGIAAGEEAAAAMLAARENDGRGDPFPVPIGSEPGEWRPTPPGFLLDPAPWLGIVRPFLVPSVEMLRSDGPNALTSTAYAEDFEEVKRVGSLTSTIRTADQTDAARFWQTNGPGLFNGVMNTLAADPARGLSSADRARLFAMGNLAMADGAIACWDDKYHWRFWRPVTAIREAANDGNAATEPDPGWTPLIVTPPFPDHPSAHGCMSAALVHTLQNFFRTDKIAFSAFSTNSRTTRSFDRLSDATKEIIDARVWGGIHFRTADVQGAVLGKKVAHFLQKHYFQPLN